MNRSHDPRSGLAPREKDGAARDIGVRVCVIGGVWAASRAYPGLRANSPRETYAFSDFPYPKGADDFPTAAQIRGYLESCCDRFGLRDRLRLGTEVVAVSRLPGSRGEGTGFRVSTRAAHGSGATHTERFGFVAVGNGVFCEPRIPDLPGSEQFRGSVLHSSQMADPDVVRGKRVVVVGAGKSALDCATTAGRDGASCTLVFRSPHWMVPRYFPGGIRMDRIFVTRAAEALLPAYHTPGPLERALHGRGAPLLRLFWRAQTRLIPRLCGMPAEMVPPTALPDGLESSGVGGEFYRAMQQGRVQARRGRIAGFTDERTLRLDSGERLQADVVVFATGWRQDLSFLEPDLRREVRQNGELRLYRHILPPGERRLGFVGYASSTACMFTSELAAHWLSQCFRGELALPSTSEMDRRIEQVRRWTAEVFPNRQGGYFIGLYIAHYADELLRDMGLPTRRVGNPLAEYLGRFWPERYRGLAEERRRRRPPRVRRKPIHDVSRLGLEEDRRRPATGVARR